MEYAIAVIDIGMTNKKVAVYDDTLTLVDARYRNFPPLLMNGLETHDLEAMDWFTEQVAQYARCYPIKGIALSTHGATFVGVGKDGKPLMPCVYYTHEPGDAFHARFYARFGSLEVLQEETGFQYFCLGTPVKTAIFLGGQEFKAWSCLLMNMHGQQELPRFDLYSVPFPAH